MESVGVFDFDEGNIGEFLVGPCESDAPFGSAGIGINGMAPGAVELVVVKRMEGKEISFGRVVKNEQAFLGFIKADVTHLFCLFSG
jgi:hypothetical protein